MSAVLSVQRFGNPAGQPAIFSKMEMQLSPFLDATFWNYCLQKTGGNPLIFPRSNPILYLRVMRSIEDNEEYRIEHAETEPWILIVGLRRQSRPRLSL